jgi:hypothetical protein
LTIKVDYFELSSIFSFESPTFSRIPALNSLALRPRFRIKLGNLALPNSNRTTTMNIRNSGIPIPNIAISSLAIAYTHRAPVNAPLKRGADEVLNSRR